MSLEVSKYLQWLEQGIQKKQYGKQPVSLYEPISYIMSLGGKRLRPLLTLIAYSLYRNDVRKIVSYGIAVEAFERLTGKKFV